MVVMVEGTSRSGVAGAGDGWLRAGPGEGDAGNDAINHGSDGDAFAAEDNHGPIGPGREAGLSLLPDGAPLRFEHVEAIVPCFTPGTLIATPRGERAVEDLRPGDRIITRDNGIQEIRWVGRRDIAGRTLVGAPHLRPILVKAGSLGQGLPERDMLVSPNHRILVSNDRTQIYFHESEVLAAAKHMVGSPGVLVVDVLGVSYIHIMFDRHEVVLSNGAWTESFQPGDWSLKGIGNAQRNELFDVFPELKTRVGIDRYEAARKSLRLIDTKLLALQAPIQAD